MELGQIAQYDVSVPGVKIACFILTATGTSYQGYSLQSKINPSLRPVGPVAGLGRVH